MSNLNIMNTASIQQMQDVLRSNQKVNSPQSTGVGQSFEEILARQKEMTGQVSTGAVKFSKHANERLDQRDIDMTQEQLNRLNEGVSKAAGKGINDSLIMVDNIAFIVNIKNNTVITAVTEGDDMVFSKIDGAVIA